jgi:RHS repeat-associated protein
MKPHSFTYNSLKGLVQAINPESGTITCSYDSSGNLSKRKDARPNAAPTNYAGAFDYFPNGALANVSLGINSLPQQYCQNSRLQIVAVRLGAAGGSTTTNCANSHDALNLAFSYGNSGYNNGNLMSETLLPLNATQSFSYDAYNRLSTAAEGSAWSQSYKYDTSGNSNVSFGNRYVSAYSGIVPLSFTPQSNANFNANNQLIIQGSSYDNSGNLKAIGGYSFTYDAESRQIGATVNGAGSTYSYDGEGRRVQKVSGGATTVYVYDAKGEVAAEYSSAAPAEVGTQYLTGDHLGSTRLVSDASGVALGYHDYLPFGEEISSGIGGRGSLYGAADGVTHKFTEKERDTETASSAMQGLDYFGARYFSGTMGRFTSADPALLAKERLADPQQWNTYGYARDNPLRYTDPTGMYVCADSTDSPNCDSAQDQAFEKARLQDLQSNDKATKNAAKAYGEKNEDNGVSVAFASVLPAICGDQAGCVEPRIKADANANISPDLKVTFKLGQSGVVLDAVVAHEGVHVEDNLNFINSFVAAMGTFDASKNFTHGQTEFKAYQVQLGILLGLLGGGHDYRILGQVFSPKDLQSQIDSKIRQGLADPANGYAKKLNELQWDPGISRK